MRTLTRTLLILAVAVALVAVGAFDPHDPEGQADCADNPLCKHCREPEVQLAECDDGAGCKDCREPEVQLATGGDEKLVPIPDPISTPGATPATQLAECDGGEGCKDCREPEPQLAGTEIGNGDAPVLEMELAGTFKQDGSGKPSDDAEGVPGYDLPVLPEIELAGTEIGNGDTPVLETMLACEPNNPGCDDDTPVLEMGLADCNAGDPGCPDAPMVELV